MTINVVVATYDAVVLGCDSLSSIVERGFFPLRGNAKYAKDADGNHLLDAHGNLTISVEWDALEAVPTNVMGSVQKMFLLHERGDQDAITASVAAVTSGLGVVRGVSISGHAARFRQLHRGEFRTALEVVKAFAAYMRPLWELEVDFAETDEKLRPRLSDLNFLVAGYGPDDEYQKVFRVSIMADECQEQFPDEPHCSCAWAGQASSAAKLINGIDGVHKWKVSRAIADTLAAQRATVTGAILQALRDRGIQVPDDFELQIEEDVPPTLPWNAGTLPVDWQNLPAQYAVDLVSLLVNTESGLQRCASNIPGVGGRTRIGLLRRGEPFAMLNEPAVIHSHLGYSNDA